VDRWTAWIILGIALAGLVWLGWTYRMSDPREPIANEQNSLVSARSPLWIGTVVAPYSYDGHAVQTASGVAQLRMDRAGALMNLSASLDLPQPLLEGSLVSTLDAATRIELQSTGILRETWNAVDIHGDTGRGDADLPLTFARWAGIAEIGLSADGHETASIGHVLWSVADGLRREDGSIGQLGLVFSPLLRDKTGFANPERVELTLLIVDDKDEPLFHIVFRDVTIEATLTTSPDR